MPGLSDAGEPTAALWFTRMISKRNAKIDPRVRPHGVVLDEQQQPRETDCMRECGWKPIPGLRSDFRDPIGDKI
jgi:hypothetical protein